MVKIVSMPAGALKTQEDFNAFMDKLMDEVKKGEDDGLSVSSGRALSDKAQG